MHVSPPTAASALARRRSRPGRDPAVPASGDRRDLGCRRPPMAAARLACHSPPRRQLRRRRQSSRWRRRYYVSLTVALVWQFILVAILVRHEQGTLRWATAREALWLRVTAEPPQRPSRRPRLADPDPLIVPLRCRPRAGPGDRRNPRTGTSRTLVESDAGKEFLSGAWGWYALPPRQLHLQHHARRGTPVPRLPASAHERCVRSQRLGCKRAVLHRLPPARAMGDARDPCSTCSSSPTRRGGTAAPGSGSLSTAPRAWCSRSSSSRS